MDLNSNYASAGPVPQNATPLSRLESELLQMSDLTEYAERIATAIAGPSDAKDTNANQKLSSIPTSISARIDAGATAAHVFSSRISTALNRIEAAL